MKSPEMGPKPSQEIGDRSSLADYYEQVKSMPEGYEELMKQSAVLHLTLINIGSRFYSGEPITEDEREKVLDEIHEKLPKLEDMRKRVNEDKSALIDELIQTFTSFKENPARVDLLIR